MIRTSKGSEGRGTETAISVGETVAGLVAAGRDIVPLHVGQPHFQPPEKVMEAYKAAVDEGYNGYTPGRGIAPLRESIAGHFTKTRGIDVKPNHIVAASGAKPFIGYSVRTLLNPGEEAILPTPKFPIYDSEVRGFGGVPVLLELRADEGFQINPERLRKLVNSNTRMIFTTSPSNPTGAFTPLETLEAIAEIAIENDLVVYSDEVYEDYVYDGKEHLSIASLPGMYERAVLVSGGSKSFCCPGWRIGWAANEFLAENLEREVINNTSCASHPSQRAMVTALSLGADHSMRNYYQGTRDMLVGGLNGIDGVECPVPDGAFYAYPKVDKDLLGGLGLKSAEELRLRLLDNGLACVADIHFGPKLAKDERLRISFCTSEENVYRGLEIFENCVS